MRSHRLVTAMKIPKHPLVRLGVAALASAGPIAFPLAQMGYSSLNQLAFWLILPTAVALAIAGLALRRTGMREVALDLTWGAIAGAFATLALEVIRYSGFRVGFMPGNLPELMGVLLLDRFALGPSTGSTIAGFAYHFWNGACFGIIFAVLAAGLQRRLAIPYGLAIGLDFS